MSMYEYIDYNKEKNLPSIPQYGKIDLTYRCNNNCRHCWLRIAPDAKEKQNELSFNEIIRVVTDARKMGCRNWAISGGEPLLRQDFAEIFELITSKSKSYSLNTNGTLITSQIARLIKNEKGNVIVSIYGATAEVHDNITRNKGSFEAAMRGLSCLKEKAVNFVVQIVPLRDNYHQLKEMIVIARSFNPHYKLNTSWMYLSASRDEQINQQILNQRLEKNDLIKHFKSNLTFHEETSCNCNQVKNDDRLYASCIKGLSGFHIDPYGYMALCPFVKDNALRYDLRKGTFEECWDSFIPSLADKIRGGQEYLDNCGSCDLLSDCRWCPAFSFLEHGRHSAKVDHLCDLAREKKLFNKNWIKKHRRYFRVADITIQIEMDIPFSEDFFKPKFKIFEVDGPGEDTVSISHHFSLPDLEGFDLGQKIYQKPPWAIYKKNSSWIYLCISPNPENSIQGVVVFNRDHSKARIYHDSAKKPQVLEGNWPSITFLPSDQIIIARLLADRQGCYFHSSGLILNGKGFLFAGYSGAGKSTISLMLQNHAEILCDDRIIVKKQKKGFHIFGTWSHGDVPDISAKSIPLHAIMFLEQAQDNRLVQITDRKEIRKRLLAFLIKPLVTKDWWEKMLTLIEKISFEVPCYIMKFDKSGAIVKELKSLAKDTKKAGDQI
ncbi:MAG: radical SAM protein [Candidatus Saganbacteria bacterium]|nr:radical SAM protein [Candidatus Saganbacteria bacterium]